MLLEQPRKLNTTSTKENAAIGLAGKPQNIADSEVLNVIGLDGRHTVVHTGLDSRTVVHTELDGEHSKHTVWLDAAGNSARFS